MTLEYFTSRNTYTREAIDHIHDFAKLRRIAQRLSFSNPYPVVANNENGFAKYEHGKCTEATKAAWLS